MSNDPSTTTDTMDDNKHITPPHTHQEKHLSTNSAMDLKSDASTLAPSGAPSVIDDERTRQVSDASEPSGLPVNEKAEADISAKSTAESKDEIDAEAEAQDDETEYPSGTKLILITIALCLSVFCLALDNTIIATAIPKITDQFHSTNDIGWYGSSYLLTTCAFQLFFGKLYSFLNLKWTYMTALGLFELGSLICGVAPNSPALIVGRAIAGLGSAGIFSGALLIVANTVPLRQRPTYTGVIGSMYGIASVAGPLMGGVFTDRLTWRWCFYINLPIGAVTVLFITFFFHPTSKASGNTQKLGDLTIMERIKLFDIVGTSIFLPTIVCLLLALQLGGSTYAWNSPRIIALLVIFGLLLIVFVAIQLKAKDNATVPARVLKQRSVAAASAFSVALGASFFVYVYFLPIWFQAIKGVDAVHSGIMNLPLILGLVLMSIVAGGLVTTVGYYTPFVIASSVLMSIGAGLLTTLHPNTGHAMWIGYQAIYGFGVGLGMQQTIIAVQTVLPKKDVPTGTAIVMFAQTLGGALFVSIADSVENNALISQLEAVVPDLDPSVVIRAGATNIKNVVPAADLSGVIVAYNTAIMHTFYVGLAMAVVSILGAVALEWKSVKGKKIEMAAA